MEFFEELGQNRREICMEIIIKDEYIRLGQALKLAGIAQSGVDAKLMIQNGLVQVNGAQELRRGRKLKDQDAVTVDGKTFYVHSNAQTG